MAAATEMFTRGQPGEADNRGESLVQRHIDLMQQQKEAAAMEKLRQLMPQAGDMVRALALSKSEWDIDKAVAMLRSFQVAHLDKVNALNKRRKKLRESMEACTGSDAEPDASGGSGDDKEGSSGTSSSSSSSSSESDDDDKASKRKRSSRKDSHKRSSKKAKRSSKDKGSKRSRKHKRSSKDKDRDKRKRRRKEAGSGSDEEGGKAQRRSLAHTQDLGKYGFIRESDMAAKNAEFMLWATEVKGVNVELLGRLEEKELFKEYMEDFNTGTLKHRKYYNLEVYEREKAAKARDKAGKGAEGAAAQQLFDARADEEAMKRLRMEERQKLQQQRMAEAYSLLKHTDRAKDMREQELLRAEMTLAYKTGDKAKAQKLFERLQPDEQKKK